MAATSIDEWLHEVVKDRLHATGQKVTANREALVGLLSAATRPLTIPEIIDARPTIAQSSAYRNLVVLEDAGLVHRIVTNDDFARYELAEDLTGHHHHLICSVCGSVQDVPAPEGLERAVGVATKAIARKTGFRAQHHRIDLVGICQGCN